jgi:hypothetical protein
LKPFSPEASEVIRQAFTWLEERANVKPEPVPAYRLYRPGMLFTEGEASTLRDYAKHSGWIERGGQMLRAYDKNASAWERKYAQGKTGEVSGRTSWVGQPEWARGFGYSKEEIMAIVEKAIAGERLASKQTILIQTMLDVMAELSAQPCPF